MTGECRCVTQLTARLRVEASVTCWAAAWRVVLVAGLHGTRPHPQLLQVSAVSPFLLPCVCRCCTTTHAHRYNADLERVVRARVRRGRHFPIMKVIPPGLDFSNLKISPPPDPLEALNPHGSGEGRGQWVVCAVGKGWVAGRWYIEAGCNQHAPRNHAAPVKHIYCIVLWPGAIWVRHTLAASGVARKQFA